MTPLPPASHDPLVLLSAGPCVEEVPSSERQRDDVALMPASEEAVIAALGRAFAFACARAEGKV